VAAFEKTAWCAGEIEIKQTAFAFNHNLQEIGDVFSTKEKSLELKDD
jgi:hypothetical protein